MNDEAVILAIVVAAAAAYLIMRRTSAAKTGPSKVAKPRADKPKAAESVGSAPPHRTVGAASTRRSKNQPIDAELLAALRELVAQSPESRRAAVTLLRESTGMSSRDAWRFVNAL
ncbi:MAG TPA: hypothetical protein VFQ15_07775 [Jiangellaceae bacterium]|nr:hypothetical protein [Jiangellaceae bacterium]